MAMTKTDVDALRYEAGGNHYLWDGNLPGFGVRVLPSGRKSYIYDYRAPDGRQRRVTIGRHGAITPAQARDRAKRLAASVLNGGDPAAERTERREALTMREFAKVYIERHAKPHKRTWKEDQRVLDRDILPVFGTRKLASFTRADVAALHARRGETAPGSANQMLRLLTVMRSRAIEWGHLPEDTPSWKVKPFASRARERWVTPDELPHLLAAIDAEESVYARGALMLALLTGMRRGEVLSLRWQDVRMEQREIHLPRTKAGRTHTLPLSSEAVVVLESLPRKLGNPYVFASETLPGTHLNDLNKQWARVRARTWLATHPEEAEALRAQAVADVARRSKHASVHDGKDAVELRLYVLANAEAKKRGDVLRLHDVRRTTGSMLAMSGASLPLIGAVLNHSSPSTTAIYARLTQDAPRAALEALAETVRAARKGGAA